MSHPIIIPQSVAATGGNIPANSLPQLRLDCSRSINLIVVHCTASRCDRRLTPESLDRIHRQRGFNGCGYHYYITSEGIIHPMRPSDHIGAHVRGFNSQSIGIAYEGGLLPDGSAADTRTPGHPDRKRHCVSLSGNCLSSTLTARFAVTATSVPT